MNTYQRKLLASLGWGEIAFQKRDGYNEVNCYRLTPIPGRSNRLAITTGAGKRDACESMVQFVAETIRKEAAANLALAPVRSGEPTCDDCDRHPDCICEVADAQYPMTDAEQLDDAMNGRR